MNNTMSLADIRRTLRENPSREFLTELVNAAQIPNPLFRTMVFAALRTLSQSEIEKYSKLAVVAIQYLEQGNREELKRLFSRVGIPAPMSDMIDAYVAHLPVHQ